MTLTKHGYSNTAALNAFRASAKKAKPTNAHRPALWENMLGTVYAANRDGVAKYFDYNWKDALEHVGAHHDVRVSRVTRGYYDLNGLEIPVGKLVWFVIFEPVCSVKAGGCGRDKEFVPSGDGGGAWKPIKLSRAGLCAVCTEVLNTK